jgi:hypothetical protein
MQGPTYTGLSFITNKQKYKNFTWGICNSLHRILKNPSPLPSNLTRNRVTSTESFLLLPTWYTNFLFIYTNHINSNPLNVSSAFRPSSGGPRRKLYICSLWYRHCLQVTVFLNGCTGQSLAESDDTRGCICYNLRRWPPDDGRIALETCREI